MHEIRSNIQPHLVGCKHAHSPTPQDAEARQVTETVRTWNGVKRSNGGAAAVNRATTSTNRTRSSTFPDTPLFSESRAHKPQPPVMGPAPSRIPFKACLGCFSSPRNQTARHGEQLLRRCDLLTFVPHLACIGLGTVDLSNTATLRASQVATWRHPKGLSAHAAVICGAGPV